MRKSLCASVLVLAFCGSAFAGDISCPPIAPGDIPNPPSAAQSSSDQTADGSIGTGATTAADDSIIHNTADSLAEAALIVLNSVLALL